MPFKDGVLAVTLNVSKIASQVLDTGLATYIELDTVLSLEDALNIIEVYQVARYNKQVMEKYGNQHH